MPTQPCFGSIFVNLSFDLFASLRRGLSVTRGDSLKVTSEPNRSITSAPPPPFFAEMVSGKESLLADPFFVHTHISLRWCMASFRLL